MTHFILQQCHLSVIHSRSSKARKCLSFFLRKEAKETNEQRSRLISLIVYSLRKIHDVLAWRVNPERSLNSDS